MHLYWLNDFVESKLTRTSQILICIYFKWCLGVLNGKDKKHSFLFLGVQRCGKKGTILQKVTLNVPVMASLLVHCDYLFELALSSPIYLHDSCNKEPVYTLCYRPPHLVCFLCFFFPIFPLPFDSTIFASTYLFWSWEVATGLWQ